MAVRRDIPRRSKLRPIASAALAASILIRPGAVVGHEGHAALPTKGAMVQGNQLLVSAKAIRSLGVECAKVTLGDLRRVIRARARIELPWSQQAMISTAVPGRIERISVRPGDAIRKGDELARIESLDLGDFQRDLLRADAELVLARRISEQREELGKQELITGASVLQAGHRRAEAEADVVVAFQKLLALGVDRPSLARLRESNRPLSILPVLSPIDGVVSEADVRAGEVVTTDRHLYHIVDPSKIAIVAEVPEADLAEVHAGRPIRATFAGAPGLIEGEIDHIHPDLNPKNRAREAVAHVANPGMALRPGQSGRAEIEVARIEGAILCPAPALIDAPDGTFVLLRRGEGRFDRRKVEIGLRVGPSVEVRDGLFPGDQVVVVGKQMLAAMFHAGAPRQGAGGVARPATPAPTVIHGVVELPTQARHRIAPRIDGRVARILVEPGQRVEAGRVLAEIDSLPLRNLQLDFLRSRLEREWTAAAVGRLRSLVGGAAVARRELWERESELVVVEAELSALRAKLLAVGLGDRDLARLEALSLDSEPEDGVISSTVPLKAQGGGIVADFAAIPGQVVRASDTLFEVLDVSRIWVRGYAFERDAEGLEVGDPASISFPCLPGRTPVGGTIVRLAPELDPGERVLRVWVEVENPGGILPEGAMATMALPGRRTAGAPIAGRETRESAR